MENATQTSQGLLSSADRIRQLNDIDQDVAKLIHSAGIAIQALTNARPEDSAHDGSLQSHKTQFKQATEQYFALLSSIDVRLRRQVYALEEATVLAPETASRTGDTVGASGGAGAGPAAASGTAANPLDVSWLNSRKDTVGKDKEAELWAGARQFMDQLEKTSTTGVEAEKMQVD
ncbi:hypothetical protein N7468_000828 [Penicillium chermesinum]|uniref:Mediator of RNA polymerase II transcription subunit 11 n=1 Tax=Penicillium chermesinum TaxID=63820 RepID=A0A9W9TW66_9EURO|nr:uncharacterized protein N7468_000828 [Penicillium chermesinum]KAJ5245845.1 hypothetical protein N7468_000828 [Penicillium chermesinum]